MREPNSEHDFATEEELSVSRKDQARKRLLNLIGVLYEEFDDPETEAYLDAARESLEVLDPEETYAA